MPVSSLNLSELDEDYNVINGPNPPSPASQVKNLFKKFLVVL